MAVLASRYRLVRTIASGGMAHVYEAIAHGERGFTRRVALKRILPQHAADESMRNMFFDEARVAGQLHHANIVQVLDYGVVDGDDFIVMEYVDGIDAARAIGRARGMPEALALYVASEVAHALAYAHTAKGEHGRALGIVHRDVSPHNLLLSWEGHVKLADFGIALATGREEKTRTGVVKGKLAYMPPEQAGGRAVTGAADVYALAATLHALVNGSPPRDTPSEPLELDPVLSDEARALIEGCMALDPDARPDAATFADRAGRLAAQRLSRDARGALTEWLAPIAAIDRSPSALDDVMGLALVASGDGRRFTVSREVAPRHEVAEPEPSIHLPTRRYGAWIAITIAVLVAIGGIATFASMSEEPAPRAGPAPPEPQPEAPTALAPMPSRIEEAVVREEPRVDQAPRAPTPPLRPRVRVPRLEAPLTPPEPAPEASQPAAPAYVRIPRVGAAPERIEIDGRDRGFTPAVVRVDAGDHRVVLRDTEGQLVLDRAIVAAAHHTAAAPLVIAR